MMTIEYKGYVAEVEYDDEARLVGRSPTPSPMPSSYSRYPKDMTYTGSSRSPSMCTWSRAPRTG